MKHFEFVPVGIEQALVIMVSENGLIENRLIKVPRGLPSSTLIEISNYLNSVLKGRSLSESQKIIDDEIKTHKEDIDNVSKSLIDQGIACWAAEILTKNSLLIMVFLIKVPCSIR